MEVKMIKKSKIVEYIECPKCGYIEEIIGNWYHSICPKCKKKLCDKCGLPNNLCVCKEIKTMRKWEYVTKDR